MSSCVRPQSSPAIRRSSFVLSLLCLGLGACLPTVSPPADSYIGPPAPAPKLPGTRAEAPPKAPALPEGPIRLPMQQALLMALESNQALRVQRLTPPIRRTAEDVERALFDPTVAADLSASRTRVKAFPVPATGPKTSTTTRLSGSSSVSQFFPTGTTLEAGATTDITKPRYAFDSATTRAGLTATQALLQGYGVAVNLASLRQARLDTLSSEYELRGFAEALVADVEETYWDYVLAKLQIDIVVASLKLAEQQQAETEERIKIGKLAETELAAAQAEVALRQEALINARSALETSSLRLRRLLNPPGGDLWGRELIPEDQPIVPEGKLDDVGAHVQVALRMRPDLNQARLLVQRGDLEVVKTKNGLLPKLDLFVTLGKSGYARSFGSSVSDLDGPSYDAATGLSFEYPLGNRAARARHEAATLSRTQSLEAVNNMAQLVQVDVRSAYIEVNRVHQQVAATRATRKLQEEVLRAETEKLRVGKTTSLLVAQAQRDLLESQIKEVQAAVGLLKGTVELYRLEGSLLERRGIVAPGRTAVDLAIPKAW